MVREGQWCAVFLRSPLGHGLIKRIDTSAALALPGVRAVITGADMDGDVPTIPFRRPNPTIGPYAQPIIARGKVRYFGEPVAVVLAVTQEVAEDALALIEVDYEQLPAAVDRATAMADKILLFETQKSNVASVFEAKKGSTDEAFAKADLIVAVGGGSAIDATKVMLIALWQNATGIEDLDLYRAGKPKEGAAPPSEAIRPPADPLGKLMSS